MAEVPLVAFLASHPEHRHERIRSQSLESPAASEHEVVQLCVASTHLSESKKRLAWLYKAAKGKQAAAPRPRAQRAPAAARRRTIRDVLKAELIDARKSMQHNRHMTSDAFREELDARMAEVQASQQQLRLCVLQAAERNPF